MHKPGDEKRSVVILPDEAWGDWLRAKSEAAARGMLTLAAVDLLRARADLLPGRSAPGSLF